MLGLFRKKKKISKVSEKEISKRSNLKHIEEDTRFDNLEKCPCCNSEQGFFSIDSMTTYACVHCGARFLASPFGLIYVGDWPSYACKDRWAVLPIDGIVGKENDYGGE